MSKMIRLVVCAAIRNKGNGTVVCGARHGDCLNSAMRYNLPDTNPFPSNKVWEMGFVDQHHEFMNRSEAWVVADTAGQLRRPTGLERHYDNHRAPNTGESEPGMLFSENLY